MSELRVLTTDDPRTWQTAIDAFAQRDSYFSATYHRLAERRGEGTARLFVAADGAVALPLLVRPFATEPWAAAPACRWSDATSVYGYAGPLVQPGTTPAQLAAFRESLTRTLAELGVVAVFSRLHPLLDQTGVLDGLGEVAFVGRTVSLDATLDDDALLAQFSKPHRKAFRQRVRAGLTWREDTSPATLDAFVRSYHENMRRVDAGSAYFFDRGYFETLLADPGLARLVCVQIDGQFACGGLALLSEEIVQLHLLATSDAFLEQSPSKAMIPFFAQFARSLGKKVLHLGGGRGGREDELFRFKTSFSDRTHDFSVWRWIVDADRYRESCSLREQWDRRPRRATEGYFPEYRKPAAPPAPPPSAQATQAILIVGAGGHGRVIADMIERRGEYRVVGFLDARTPVGTVVAGYPVLGSDSELAEVARRHDVQAAVVAIGDNAQRLRVAQAAREARPDLAFPVVVHPSAVLGASVVLGPGTVVMPGAVVNASARVGEFCILNTHCSLDHDSRMGDFASLAPNACIGGAVDIGEGSAICLGADVIGNLRIGPHAVVGAGAVVVKDIPGFVVAYGNPARVVRERVPGDPYL